MSQPLGAVSHNAATLRRTTEADLPAISELTEAVFGRRRSLDVLRWLLLSAQPGLDVMSEVAVNNDDGRLVGHVGVLKSLYQWGEHIAVGAHPMLWMLHPDARGRIGIQLGHACTRSGDFSLVVGGTPASKPIMDKRRFVRSAATTELRLPTDVGTAGEARGALGQGAVLHPQVPGRDLSRGALHDLQPVGGAAHLHLEVDVALELEHRAGRLAPAARLLEALDSGGQTVAEGFADLLDLASRSRHQLTSGRLRSFHC